MRDKLVKGIVASIWFGLLSLAILGMSGCTPSDLIEARSSIKEVVDDLGDRARDVVINNWKARERIREECWDSVKRSIDKYRELGDEDALRKFLIKVYPPLNISEFLEQGLDYTKTPQLCGDQVEEKKEEKKDE